MNRIAVLAVLLCSLPAHAEQSDSGAQHSGFYASVEPGFGYFSTSATSGGSDLEISGAGGSFAFSIGGALSESATLAVTCWAAAVTNPSLTSGGTSVSSVDTSVAASGCGPTIIFWAMPSNAYFSATAGLTSMQLEFQGTKASTQTGFGLRLAGGKTWVGQSGWGFGLGGVLHWGANEDQGTDPPTWKTVFVGVNVAITKI